MKITAIFNMLHRFLSALNINIYINLHYIILKLLIMKNKKLTILTFLLGFISFPIRANNKIQFGLDNIDPPPAAPIDTYLVFAIVICVAFSSYFFYKYNKTYLKDGC